MSRRSFGEGGFVAEEETKTPCPTDQTGRFETKLGSLSELRGLLRRQPQVPGGQPRIGGSARSIIANIIAVPGPPYEGCYRARLIINCRHLATPIDKNDNGFFAPPETALVALYIGVGDTGFTGRRACVHN